MICRIKIGNKFFNLINTIGWGMLIFLSFIELSLISFLAINEYDIANNAISPYTIFTSIVSAAAFSSYEAGRESSLKGALYWLSVMLMLTVVSTFIVPESFFKHPFGAAMWSIIPFIYVDLAALGINHKDKLQFKERS
jgi:hypothetical protein